MELDITSAQGALTSEHYLGAALEGRLSRLGPLELSLQSAGVDLDNLSIWVNSGEELSYFWMASENQNLIGL